MKSLFALIAVGLMAASASAADTEISRGTLSAIGLPGFAKMSNAQAMSVRGKGYHSYASVGGTSGAVTHNGGAGSSNWYLASGSHSASGSNYSYAVQGTAVAAGPFSGIIISGVIAGGGSSASAH